MKPGQPDSSPTTEDAFLGGRLVIEQPRSGYRAGLDAVLLAACVAGGTGTPLRVLDVGAGVGTAGLCVARRLSQARVTLLERETAFAALARANIERNGMTDRAIVLEADVLAAAAQHEAAGLRTGSFDVVVCNPPYLSAGRSTLPADSVSAAAFGMPAEDLERWVRFMARMTATGGEAIMIHRADALAALLAAFIGRFGGLVVQPMHPRAGELAHRVIVSGIKGSRAPLQLRDSLVLHGEGHAFLARVADVLRDGEGLPLRG